MGGVKKTAQNDCVELACYKLSTPADELCTGYAQDLN